MDDQYQSLRFEVILTTNKYVTGRDGFKPKMIHENKTHGSLQSANVIVIARKYQ